MQPHGHRTAIHRRGHDVGLCLVCLIPGRCDAPRHTDYRVTRQANPCDDPGNQAQREGDQCLVSFGCNALIPSIFAPHATSAVLSCSHAVSSAPLVVNACACGVGLAHGAVSLLSIARYCVRVTITGLAAVTLTGVAHADRHARIKPSASFRIMLSCLIQSRLEPIGGALCGVALGFGGG